MMNACQRAVVCGRTHFQELPWRALLATILLALSFSLPLSAAGDESASTEKILEVWKTQRAAVQTARVQIKIIDRPVSAAVTPEQAQSALANLVKEIPADNVESRQAVLEACLRQLLGAEMPANWGNLEIIVDGDSLRNTATREAGVWMDVAATEGVDVRFMPTQRQANVKQSNKVNEARFGVDYFRFIPIASAGWKTDANTGPLGIRLTSEATPDLKVRVDNRFLMVDQVETFGHITKFQSAFREYSGGVIAPQYGIRVGWSQKMNRPRSVSAFIVEHADFNSAIDPVQFQIAVPKGTKVIDSRRPNRVMRGVVRFPEKNVVRFAETINPGTGPYFTWFRIIVFGFLLVLGCAIILAAIKGYGPTTS